MVDRAVDRARRERAHDLAVLVSLRLAALDRPRAGFGLLHLERAILVDPLEVDLAERPIAEEGDEVPQRPAFVLGRLLGDLAGARLGQLHGEGAEGLRLAAFGPLASAPALLLRQHPEPAAHVGEDVLQLHLGFGEIPAFVLVTESQVLALAVGAKAKCIDAAELPLAHEHPTFPASAHGQPCPYRAGQAVIDVRRSHSQASFRWYSTTASGALESQSSSAASPRRPAEIEPMTYCVGRRRSTPSQRRSSQPPLFGHQYPKTGKKAAAVRAFRAWSVIENAPIRKSTVVIKSS